MLERGDPVRMGEPPPPGGTEACSAAVVPLPAKMGRISRVVSLASGEASVVALKHGCAVRSPCSTRRALRDTAA